MKKLRLLRAEKDWNQEIVANKLGVSIPAYSKMESGITDINLSRLRQLAEIYDRSLIDLMCFLENDKVDIKITDLDAKDTKIQEQTNEIIELQRKLIQLSELVIKQNVSS